MDIFNRRQWLTIFGLVILGPTIAILGYADFQQCKIAQSSTEDVGVAWLVGQRCKNVAAFTTLSTLGLCFLAYKSINHEDELKDG